MLGPMRASLSFVAMLLGGSTLSGSTLPVVIGGSPDVDACSSLGAITIGKAVTLRSGPGEKYQRLATLAAGDFVHLCSTSPDGNWSGVILAQDGILDCGVSSPVSPAKEYQGPCQWGWVPIKRVSPVAG
ncbi:hypothetical protein FB548_2454 [Pseudoxanthomonas sp. 3HH-4]|nr:hypothetical protein FB548_2454 [Pseudoxanthomonas sp. 3HH-4]